MAVEDYPFSLLVTGAALVAAGAALFAAPLTPFLTLAAVTGGGVGAYLFGMGVAVLGDRLIRVPPSAAARPSPSAATEPPATELDDPDIEEALFVERLSQERANPPRPRRLH
jgi:hypothetical protein